MIFQRYQARPWASGLCQDSDREGGMAPSLPARLACIDDLIANRSLTGAAFHHVTALSVCENAQLVAAEMQHKRLLEASKFAARKRVCLRYGLGHWQRDCQPNRRRLCPHVFPLATDILPPLLPEPAVDS
jgi:hypothetical protein